MMQLLGPIADMLGPEDDELVIVSDGALCLTPWTAVIESMRVRILPSLTSYELILRVPRRASQEDRGAFGRKSLLERVKRSLARLTMCSKGSRSDWNNSQHYTSNREKGN